MQQTGLAQQFWQMFNSEFGLGAKASSWFKHDFWWIMYNLMSRVNHGAAAQNWKELLTTHEQTTIMPTKFTSEFFCTQFISSAQATWFMLIHLHHLTLNSLPACTCAK